MSIPGVINSMVLKAKLGISIKCRVTIYRYICELINNQNEHESKCKKAKENSGDVDIGNCTGRICIM